MKQELTEQEWDLIESIRNFKKSKHSENEELEHYIINLFENLMYDE